MALRAPLHPAPVALATRRSLARVRATEARAKLLEVARLLDGGGNTTGHENAKAAVTTCQDVIDAVDGHISAERERFRRDDELAKASFE